MLLSQVMLESLDGKRRSSKVWSSTIFPQKRSQQEATLYSNLITAPSLFERLDFQNTPWRQRKGEKQECVEPASSKTQPTPVEATVDIRTQTASRQFEDIHAASHTQWSSSPHGDGLGQLVAI